MVCGKSSHHMEFLFFIHAQNIYDNVYRNFTLTHGSLLVALGYIVLCRKRSNISHNFAYLEVLYSDAFTLSNLYSIMSAFKMFSNQNV